MPNGDHSGPSYVRLMLKDCARELSHELSRHPDLDSPALRAITTHAFKTMASDGPISDVWQALSAVANAAYHVSLRIEQKR